MWGMNLHGSAVGSGGGECQLAQALASAAGMFSVVDGVGGTSDGVGGTSDGVLAAGVVACAASWELWSSVSHLLVWSL